MTEIISFTTREVRWFLEYPVPEAGRWFEALPQNSYTRESREDVYLVLPDRTDLGVKFRENRLELKYRRGNSETAEIAPGMTGVFESWEKLGFPTTPEIVNSVLPEGSHASRIPVLKRRLATMMETSGETVTFNPLGTPVTAGIQLEYTELQVPGASWYTLGLEWPGDRSIAFPAGLISNLKGAVKFEAAMSMGYPAFLQRAGNLREGF